MVTQTIKDVKDVESLRVVVINRDDILVEGSSKNKMHLCDIVVPLLMACILGGFLVCCTIMLINSQEKKFRYGSDYYY